MYTKLKKINEGFTIVETLIVLAIAALIITIVLIAVPDLQRSARNTDILHDAQNVASGIQTFESNNSGALPVAANITQTGSIVKISGGNGTVVTTATVSSTDTVVAEASGHAVPGYATPGVSGTSVGPGMIQINLDQECNSITANNRGVAVYYPIEANGTGSVGCIQE